MMNFVQHSIKEANGKKEKQEQLADTMEQVNPKLEEISETQIIMMEVQATTYEAILALQKEGKV